MMGCLQGFVCSRIAVFREAIDPTLQRVGTMRARGYEAICQFNRRFGLPREKWLELTLVALRILAPLAAAFLCLFLFPPFVAQILIVPMVLSTIFLSAFYGVPEEGGGEVDVYLDSFGSHSSFKGEGEDEIEIVG